MFWSRCNVPTKVHKETKNLVQFSLHNEFLITRNSDSLQHTSEVESVSNENYMLLALKQFSHKIFFQNFTHFAVVVSLQKKIKVSSTHEISHQNACAGHDTTDFKVYFLVFGPLQPGKSSSNLPSTAFCSHSMKCSPPLQINITRPNQLPSQSIISGTSTLLCR